MHSLLDFPLMLRHLDLIEQFGVTVEDFEQLD
jgi:hypothetical protein